MNKWFTIALTGIFILSLQGPGRTQKEVSPPPIPPLLEGQRPLEHVETKEPAAPRKLERKKSQVKSRQTKSRKQVKKQRRAKVKKLAGKKRQAAAKKLNRKASKRKRPAVTRRQAGPDEG